MNKQLDSLLKNIQQANNFTYTDNSPQRLRVNIQMLIDNGYVNTQFLNGAYIVQLTDAGAQYLQQLN